MFTLQGLSVIIAVFCAYMMVKKNDGRWGYPMIAMVVLAVWSPWKKEVTNMRTIERPVATQEIVEKREGDTETLEQKQQKLIEKSKGNN